MDNIKSPTKIILGAALAIEGRPFASWNGIVWHGDSGGVRSNQWGPSKGAPTPLPTAVLIGHCNCNQHGTATECIHKKI